MQVDPLAALKLWPVIVEIGDREYTIPAAPAADWIVAVLRTDTPFPLLSLLEPDDYEELKDHALIEQDVPMEEVARVSEAALEVASGWKWWTAQLLIMSAAQEWRIIGGEMTKRGLDPRTLPLGAWLNGIYAMATERLDANERAAFDMRLDRPPVSAAVPPEQRAEWAAESFMAAIAEAGGSLQMPPGTA